MSQSWMPWAAQSAAVGSGLAPGRSERAGRVHGQLAGTAGQPGHSSRADSGRWHGEMGVQHAGTRAVLPGAQQWLQGRAGRLACVIVQEGVGPLADLLVDVVAAALCARRGRMGLPLSGHAMGSIHRARGQQGQSQAPGLLRRRMRGATVTSGAPLRVPWRWRGGGRPGRAGRGWWRVGRRAGRAGWAAGCVMQKKDMPESISMQ